MHHTAGDTSLNLTLPWELIRNPSFVCSPYTIFPKQPILFLAGPRARRPPTTRYAVYFAPVSIYWSLHSTMYNGIPSSCPPHPTNPRLFSFNLLSVTHWCAQVIVPVLVDDIWCAYMFDIHNSQLHVLDPVHCPERARLHNFFKTTFLKALAGCFEAFYDNWSLSAADCWQFHYPQLCPQNISRYKLPPPPSPHNLHSMSLKNLHSIPPNLY